MIRVIQIKDDRAWDDYVAAHPMSNCYHASHWSKIIKSAYGYTTYKLAASFSGQPTTSQDAATSIKGVLPLVHMKSAIFGNRLVSMPFFDHGGILTDSPDSEERLMQAAFELGKKLNVQHIELRHLSKISCLEDGRAALLQTEPADSEVDSEKFSPGWRMRSHKVRLLLPLPDSSQALMEGFRSKLRSQINRPIKAGLSVKMGGMELLDDFYTVFSTNMRDLGSPVHAKLLLKCVMEQFQNDAKIVLVFKSADPVAAGLILGFKEVMINPWASSLRQHSKESPNMLLYWHMLAYAADHGFRYFDFGRSTPREGSFRFKVQWGAQAHPMYWYTFFLNRPKDTAEFQDPLEESGKRALAVKLWQKLPISLSRLIGPAIRKHIDL